MWINYLQIGASILTSIIMPILIVILARHSARSDRDRRELLDTMKETNDKLDAHILWHMR